MRFQVPQFIEVEDKIFGPLTFKQFVYLAGGAGVVVVTFTFLPKFFAILFSLPVAALALALAFYKINDKPFINVVEAFFNYSLTNKLYIWKKEEKAPVMKTPLAASTEQIQVPRLSESKLKELTWSLDIKENKNPITDNREDEI
jgi:hypothetical protein